MVNTRCSSHAVMLLLMTAKPANVGCNCQQGLNCMHICQRHQHCSVHMRVQHCYHLGLQFGSVLAVLECYQWAGSIKQSASYCESDSSHFLQCYLAMLHGGANLQAMQPSL